MIWKRLARLKPGMVLGADLLDKGGNVVLDAGHTLDAHSIEELQKGLLRGATVRAEASVEHESPQPPAQFALSDLHDPYVQQLIRNVRRTC